MTLELGILLAILLLVLIGLFFTFHTLSKLSLLLDARFSSLAASSQSLEIATKGNWSELLELKGQMNYLKDFITQLKVASHQPLPPLPENSELLRMPDKFTTELDKVMNFEGLEL